MNKKVFGPQTWLYVEPTVLVGSNVNGKPNFMAVAWAGIACGRPSHDLRCLTPYPVHT